MPIWKFKSTETAFEESYENQSTVLSAYNQAIEDIISFLRAHDGLEFQDLNSFMVAAEWTTDDLVLNLLAYLQVLEDQRTEFRTWGTGYEDLKSALYAYFLAVEDVSCDLQTLATGYENFKNHLKVVATGYVDFKTYLEAYSSSIHDKAISLKVAKQLMKDFKTGFEAVSNIILRDSKLYLEVTSGLWMRNMRCKFVVSKRIPSFKSLYAQRLTAVVIEV